MRISRLHNLFLVLSLVIIFSGCPSEATLSPNTANSNGLANQGNLDVVGDENRDNVDGEKKNGEDAEDGEKKDGEGPLEGDTPESTPRQVRTPRKKRTIPSPDSTPPLTPTPQPTPAASPSPSPKKIRTFPIKKGQFPFPPPQVAAYKEINRKSLITSPTEVPTFNEISSLIVDQLNTSKAGYAGQYRYFSYNKNEFAIVTRMERIKADGSPLDDPRWIEANDASFLPSANSFREYVAGLINGKKAYYRVFAFVVTEKEKYDNFGLGDMPTFDVAKRWVTKGSPSLKRTNPSKVEETRFTEGFAAYVLVYLFVDHTSLRGPVHITALNEDGSRPFEAFLDDELKRNAETHLIKAGIGNLR